MSCTVRPPSARSSTPTPPAPSPMIVNNGCAGGTSVLRKVPSSSSGTSSTAGARKSSRSSDEWSARCKSSRTSSSGCRRACSTSAVAAASNNWNRSAPGATRSPVSSSGRRSAGASIPDPASTPRRICVHGQDGGAPSVSRQRPQTTRKSRLQASRTASSARRLLPIPGSQRAGPCRRDRRPPPSCSGQGSTAQRRVPLSRTHGTQCAVNPSAFSARRRAPHTSAVHGPDRVRIAHRPRREHH